MAKTLHLQTLLDFAIQHTGSVSNAFLIAKANGLAISDEIAVGTELVIPNTIENQTEIINYYASKNIEPASAVTMLKSRPEGIGFWIIADDNIVQ